MSEGKSTTVRLGELLGKMGVRADGHGLATVQKLHLDELVWIAKALAMENARLDGLVCTSRGAGAGGGCLCGCGFDDAADFDKMDFEVAPPRTREEEDGDEDSN